MRGRGPHRAVRLRGSWAERGQHPARGRGAGHGCGPHRHHACEAGAACAGRGASWSASRCPSVSIRPELWGLTAPSTRLKKTSLVPSPRRATGAEQTSSSWPHPPTQPSNRLCNLRRSEAGSTSSAGCRRIVRPSSSNSNIVHYKELRVTATTACSTGDCVQAAAILNSGLIDLSPLVTHRFPLQEAAAAFAAAEGKKSLKVVLEP